MQARNRRSLLQGLYLGAEFRVVMVIPFILDKDKTRTHAGAFQKGERESTDAKKDQPVEFCDMDIFCAVVDRNVLLHDR